MQKNILYLSLQKLAGGDRSSLTKVCDRLANRLLFVSAVVSAKGESLKYEARKVLWADDRRVVPVFTAEKIFREWAKQQGFKPDCLSVLGADFCAALDVHSSIVVDPGTEHQVVLDPETIDEIASAPIDEEMFADRAESEAEDATSSSAPAPTPSRLIAPAQPAAPSSRVMFGMPGAPTKNFVKTSTAPLSAIGLSSVGEGESPVDSEGGKKPLSNFLKSGKL